MIFYEGMFSTQKSEHTLVTRTERHIMFPVIMKPTQHERQWVLRRALEIVKGMKAAPAYTGHTGEGGSLYCRHGSYLGTWYGPDYLCGACEDGVDDYTYALRSAGYAYTREMTFLVSETPMQWCAKHRDAAQYFVDLFTE